MFAQREIVLYGAAQQPPFGIQITEMAIDFDPGRIDLDYFLIGGDSLEGRNLRAECAGGLQKRRDGSAVALRLS